MPMSELSLYPEYWLIEIGWKSMINLMAMDS